MTLHPPETNRKKAAYKVAFIGISLVAIGLIIWQAVRSSAAQDRLQVDVHGARQAASSAKAEAKSAREEMASLRLDLARESGRREQAERSLESAIQRTGQETRAGVAEDFRRSPIKLDVASLKQPPRIVSVNRLPREPNPSPPYEAQFLVTIDQPVTPVRLLVECSNGLTSAHGTILGAGAHLLGGWGGRLSDTQWGVGISAPAWTPQNPLLVTVRSNQRDLGVCQFRH